MTNVLQKQYFLRVLVWLHQPIYADPMLDRPIHGDLIEPGKKEPPLVGYFRNFGVTAASEWEARTLIQNIVDDGEIEWGKVSWAEVDLRSLDQQIAKQCEDSTLTGVWYKSGRILFPYEQEDRNNG